MTPRLIMISLVSNDVSFLLSVILLDLGVMGSPGGRGGRDPLCMQRPLTYTKGLEQGRATYSQEESMLAP